MADCLSASSRAGKTARTGDRAASHP